MNHWGWLAGLGMTEELFVGKRGDASQQFAESEAAGRHP